MSNINLFKAPQIPIRSSWKQEVFKRPKKSGPIVNRSLLHSRQSPLVKSQGSFVQKDIAGYQY
jgi:hypothetical protein